MSEAPNCHPPDDLRRFLLGQLPESEADAIERHLAGRERCLDTIGTMRASDTLLVAVQSQARAGPPPEADVVRELMARLSGLHPDSSADQLYAQIALAPPQSPEELGRLGGYCILKMLGVGGMGIVFEAEDPRLKRRVAVKVMKLALARISANRERFLREAQATAAIEHDHVVTIHQVGEDGGVPFLAMPLLKGQTLEDRLDQDLDGGGPSKSLPVAEVLRISREIAVGLAAAHAQGLTHRDIKPANIWLEKSGRVKILDFGLARPVQDGAHLTQSGLIAGTPQYMAPEQVTGKKVDHLADLFALGCVLYRLTTGRLPFNGPDSLAILHALALEQPPPPRQINPSVPPALSDLTMRLLAKEPRDRPQSATEVAAALDAISRSHLPDGTSLRDAIPPQQAQPALITRRATHITAALLLIAAPVAVWYAPAIYRIATNQGLLVIETDDPAVEVTVRQNGQLIKIVDTKTGKEVTLKAGIYQLELSGDRKQGLKLETNQFALIRGGREIARFRREQPASTATVSTIATPPGSPTFPFVVLNGGDNAEQKFATLAEAVVAAHSGDTIEVRGDGPFVTKAIKSIDTILVIRAGAGFRPVFRIEGEGRLLYSNQRLVLEGLEIQRVGTTNDFLIYSKASSLMVANCRFALDDVRFAVIFLDRCDECNVINSHFIGVSMKTLCQWASNTATMRLVLANNVVSGVGASEQPAPSWSVGFGNRGGQGIFRLVNNTFKGPHLSLMNLNVEPDMPVLPVEASGNVFDPIGPLVRTSFPNGTSSKEPAARAPRYLAWQGKQNVYSDTALSGVRSFKGLGEWEEFWGAKETGSLRGPIRFQGGDLAARIKADPHRLMPHDFRLARGGLGQGAGENGRDLGADVSLVGPGPAYDAWRTTPDYEQWRKAVSLQP